MPGTRSKRWTLVASALALLTSGVAAPRASAQTPEAAAPATTMTPPRVTKFVEAKRPDTTPAEGAAVDLELTIAADGTLTDAKVVGSAGDELDAAALDAVKQFTFEPARKGDKPIPARIRYRYTFEPVPAPAAPDAAAGADAAPLPPSAKAAPRPGRLEGRVLAAKGGAPIPGATITLLVGHRRRRRNDAGRRGRRVRVRRRRARALQGARRGGRLPDRRDAGDGDGQRSHGDHLSPRSRRDKSGTEYEFGATASIAAPPREVVKRTLTPDELVQHRRHARRSAARRSSYCRAWPARPAWPASSSSAASSPFDSQAYFEGGAGRSHLPLRRPRPASSTRACSTTSTSTPGNFSARYGRKMGGIIDVGIRDPKTDGFHGMADVNLIDASLHRSRGRSASAARSPSPPSAATSTSGSTTSSPQDAIGVTAAPVYYDYQAVYTYRPESGGKVRTMFLGSGDEFRLNLKQPADGDPTLRGNFGARHVVPPPADDLAAQLGAHVEQDDHRRRRDDRPGPGGGRLARVHASTATTSSCAPSGARSSARTCKLIGGFDGNAIQVDVTYVGPAVPVDRRQPALLLRPAHRPADGDVQGLVHELPPRRLPRGA